MKPLYWWPHFAPHAFPEEGTGRIVVWCYFHFWRWSWKIGLPGIIAIIHVDPASIVRGDDTVKH